MRGAQRAEPAWRPLSQRVPAQQWRSYRSISTCLVGLCGACWRHKRTYWELQSGLRGQDVTGHKLRRRMSTLSPLLSEGDGLPVYTQAPRRD